ncbi:MAG: protein jag, partial [Erysipelotrichaceae bacterium]|nr:protein jag [Erysipelotrichaceae bacterium]
DRYKKVKAIARREAINVSKTHVDCELDPMPNDERKVIHQYLQDFKNVSTVSIGEGAKRHLCIKYTPEEEKEA